MTYSKSSNTIMHFPQIYSGSMFFAILIWDYGYAVMISYYSPLHQEILVVLDTDEEIADFISTMHFPGIEVNPEERT